MWTGLSLTFLAHRQKKGSALKKQTSKKNTTTNNNNKKPKTEASERVSDHAYLAQLVRPLHCTEAPAGRGCRGPSRRQQWWQCPERAHIRRGGLLGDPELRSRGSFVRRGGGGDGSDARCQAAVARRRAGCVFCVRQRQLRREARAVAPWPEVAARASVGSRAPGVPGPRSPLRH